MFSQPTFSVPLDSDIAGDDPLGLAPVNERLYGAVFPGVNNVVRYIRVYSALCWMVQQAERHLKKNASILKQREAKQIFDQAIQKMQLLIAWVNKEKPYREIAGTRREFPSHDKPVRLLFSTFGKSTASLLDAVAYRPSITNGLGFLEQKSGNTFSCTPAGEKLAEAFDEQARTSRLYKWLADVTALDICRSDVLKLEAILDVGQPSGPEQVAFLSQFFPSPRERDFDNLTRNRCLALNLVLRAVDAIVRVKRGKGKPDWAIEDEIRACMARGRTSDGTLLHLSGLNTVQAWWAVLQLRQLQRLAIDVLYCVVERWLGKQSIEDGDTSVEACAKSIGTSVLEGLETDFQHTVQPLITLFMKATGDTGSLYSAACTVPPDDQLDLFTYIVKLLDVDMEFGDTGANVAVTMAYKALVFCAVETANLLAAVDTKDVLLKDQDSCSLVALKSLVFRMSKATPEALVGHLIKHWVVLRHFQVVADRSRNADGKNRFRFVVGDHGLERFDPTARMPRPPFAQDRLKHILILCAQSGLLKSRNGEYRLSGDGRNRIKEWM